jgi:hypothetical protein
LHHVSDISIGNKSEHAEFKVIKGNVISLLGSDTAMQLGVLKIGTDINAVHSMSKVDKIVQEFCDKKLFEGLGKVKGRQIRLSLNPEVKPVAQPVRRTPFGIHNKVEDKIKEMIDMDVIEPVKEPTPWVSPIVVVPKASGDQFVHGHAPCQ